MGRLGPGETSAAALHHEDTDDEAPGAPTDALQPADEEDRAHRDDALMDAVVKVFCTHSEPNFSLPWQRKRQFASSGSGFVLSGRRILT
jgi:hypothetical protein